MLKKCRIFCSYLDLYYLCIVFQTKSNSILTIIMHHDLEWYSWKIGRVTECAGLEIRYTLFWVSGV